MNRQKTVFYMKKFIEYIVAKITESEDVKVLEKKGKQSVLIEIHACDKHLARIIGKRGNTINAIREVASLTGRKIEKSVVVEVVETKS
jgi:uncharacterized protein